MGIRVILGMGGAYLIVTIIGMVLDKAGKPEQSKMLELVAILTGMGVTVGLLSQLIGNVQSVFNLY